MAEDSGRINPPFSPPDCPWVTMTAGSTIPENVAKGFGQLKGETVYIGRVFDEDCYLVGTVLKSTGACLYLNKKCEIKSTTSYDILTIDCGSPLEFRPMSLDSNLLFVSGGDEDMCLYCSRVVDGENTYIGWADQDTKTVYIPRDPKDGPNKLEDKYDILLHKYLDRLCICPVPPRPPKF